MKDAASVFTNQLLNLKRGEKLLVYVDDGSDESVAKVIVDSAREIGAVTELLELNSELKLPDMVHQLTSKIEAGTYHVIAELSEQYFYLTPAWKRALQLGCRLYSLQGMNSDSFIDTVGKVDHNLMFQFGWTLRDILKKASFIQITAKNGTDIKFQMNTNLVYRIISKIRGKLASYVYYPSGILNQRIKSCFLGGQLGFLGVPETIEGTVVVDGYLWPPKEIGLIEDDPIILQIKNGHVTEITGCPVKKKILDQLFKEEPKSVQHFCIGFNPGAKLSGKLMETERVFGCFNIGIGEYPYHIDGIIENPSLLVNGEIIEQDGSFIHKKLAPQVKELFHDKK